MNINLKSSFLELQLIKENDGIVFGAFKTTLMIYGECNKIVEDEF